MKTVSTARIILIAALFGAACTSFFEAQTDGMAVTEKQKLEQQTDNPTRVETPSDANNASLKDTLDWLKKQITKYAGPVTAPTQDLMTLEFAKFNSCGIEWGLRPHSTSLDAPGRPRTFPFYAMIYSTDLKYLDPQTVEVTQSGKSGGSLQFATRGNEDRIRLLYKDEADGRVNNFMTRKLNSASFELRKNDLGPALKDALSHAIKLCQASPTK